MIGPVRATKTKAGRKMPTVARSAPGPFPRSDSVGHTGYPSAPGVATVASRLVVMAGEGYCNLDSIRKPPN